MIGEGDGEEVGGTGKSCKRKQSGEAHGHGKKHGRNKMAMGNMQEVELTVLREISEEI